MRQLLILRHGKAHDAKPGDDRSRELTDGGKRDAQRIGVWLSQNELLPDCILSSPATRARRTAEKTCKTAGLAEALVGIDDRLYSDSLEGILNALRAVAPECQRVLCVGHNPLLEESLGCIAGCSVKLNPAAMAVVNIPNDWRTMSEHCAALERLVDPDTLPRRFPFVLPSGATDWRARPAYYYSQSSVVPYRWHRGTLEVCIVSSSKRKHWVIPKGIHDPQTTAQASAAKEAYEEAGVRGRVIDVVLGQYQYEKWQSVCEVVVFPMEVTEEIPPEHRLEKERDRQWVAVSQAAALVKNSDVSKVILRLPETLGSMR